MHHSDSEHRGLDNWNKGENQLKVVGFRALDVGSSLNPKPFVGLIYCGLSFQIWGGGCRLYSQFCDSWATGPCFWQA